MPDVDVDVSVCYLLFAGCCYWLLFGGWCWFDVCCLKPLIVDGCLLPLFTMCCVSSCVVRWLLRVV